MFNRKKLPPLSVLTEIFKYDRGAGVLVWQNHPNVKTAARMRGRKAGCICQEGYVYVSIEQKDYLVHRLVWLMEKGEVPDVIDHIDGNKSNNRIENLRASTDRKNSWNTDHHRRGRLPGCYFHKKAGKWHAQAKVNKKIIYLGLHGSQLRAYTAYYLYIRSLN